MMHLIKTEVLQPKEQKMGETVAMFHIKLSTIDSISVVHESFFCLQFPHHQAEETR